MAGSGPMKWRCQPLPIGEGIAALSQLAELSRLEVLEFGSNWLSDDAWDLRGGAKLFSALHRLGIGHSPAFTEGHARAIVESPHVPALRVVSALRNVPLKVKNILRSRFVVWG